MFVLFIVKFVLYNVSIHWNVLLILLLLFQIFNTKFQANNYYFFFFFCIYFLNIKKHFLLIFFECELAFYSFRRRISHFLQHLETWEDNNRTFMSAWYCMNASHSLANDFFFKRKSIFFVKTKISFGITTLFYDWYTVFHVNDKWKNSLLCIFLSFQAGIYGFICIWFQKLKLRSQFSAKKSFKSFLVHFNRLKFTKAIWKC